MTDTEEDALSADGPIESYLDHLHESARALPAREARHLVAETEAHLYDAAAELVSTGASTHDAERRAIDRFGPAAALVYADRTRSRASVAAVARRTMVSGFQLGSIGAVLVGVSGLVAGLIRLVGGPHALVDVPPGTTLSAADCTRWAGSGASPAACRAAAIGDWTAETIYYRIAFGIIGVLVLLATRALVRRSGHFRPLDGATSDTVALTLLIVGGLWTLGLGVDAAVVGGGSGQWFSGAVVALAAATYYAIRVTRRLQAAGA